MKSIPLLLRPSAFIVAAADAGCGPDALNNQLSTIYDHKPLKMRDCYAGSEAVAATLFVTLHALISLDHSRFRRME